MKLLYLSLLSFVFISSAALALAEVDNFIQSNDIRPKKDFPALPVIAKNASFPIISAQAALAVDLDSRVSLYEKNPDSPLLPASTTKIITALVALEYYPLDLVLKVHEVKIDGQKMGLVKGERITVESLLYGLLVYSANDAAEVLAENFPASPAGGPGGRDLFIAAMNIKAKELNLSHSRFNNPTGLDGNGHVSTARDLILVSEVAMRDPVFAKIVGTKQIIVKSIDGKVVHNLRNINELLGSVEGVLGVKTGWTENARENLVTYLERDGKKIMIVLLGSQDRFGETTELIDWIFANYTWQEVSPPFYSP